MFQTEENLPMLLQVRKNTVVESHDSNKRRKDKCILVDGKWKDEKDNTKDINIECTKRPNVK